MKCRACKQGGAKVRRGLVLCPNCHRQMEIAIKNWAYNIDRDLAIMVAFDAYCASREESDSPLIR
jgi:transcription elongation factor Elf1